MWLFVYRNWPIVAQDILRISQEIDGYQLNFYAYYLDIWSDWDEICDENMNFGPKTSFLHSKKVCLFYNAWYPLYSPEHLRNSNFSPPAGPCNWEKTQGQPYSKTSDKFFFVMQNSSNPLLINSFYKSFLHNRGMKTC